MLQCRSRVIPHKGHSSCKELLMLLLNNYARYGSGNYH